MKRNLMITAATLAVIAVILGAMGAHLLEDKITAQQMNSFQTGLRYQMYHAIVLLFLGNFDKINTRWISSLMLAGVVLFSGSIYLLSTKDLLGMQNITFLGPITPLGGLLMISAWIIFIYKLWVMLKNIPVKNE